MINGSLENAMLSSAKFAFCCFLGWFFFGFFFFLFSFFNHSFTQSMNRSRGCWGKEERQDTHRGRKLPRNGLKENTEVFSFNLLTRAKTCSYTFIN